MMTLDLNFDRFRALALGRAPAPDHPLATVREAQKMVEALPGHDPAAALAELTGWVSAVNADPTFSRGRRARVLMILDESARPIWRALGERFLARDGGDGAILRALFESASRFAEGFATVTGAMAGESAWVKRHAALVYLRHMRWLGRRLVLGHMLHLPSGGATWERLHALQQQADDAGVARTLVPAFATSRYPTCVRQEYARLLLLELAAPEGLRARQVELVYRIAGRLASGVKLEAAPGPQTWFAVVPAGAATPGRIADALRRRKPAPLYIDTQNALARLRTLLERDAERRPADPEPLYGAQFELRERTAMVERLLAHLGDARPQRRGQRIALGAEAPLVHGFPDIAGVVPALRQHASGEEAARALELLLDAPARPRGAEQAASQPMMCRVLDASTGGLGVSLPRAGASWVRHGVLVATRMDEGGDWVVGVVRRIVPMGGGELRIGLEVLSSRPRSILLRMDGEDSPWEEAMRFEASFAERFRRAILLAPQALPLAAGEMLLPPRLAREGARFEVPLPQRAQALSVTQLQDEAHYQRAGFVPHTIS